MSYNASASFFRSFPLSSCRAVKSNFLTSSIASTAASSEIFLRPEDSIKLGSRYSRISDDKANANSGHYQKLGNGTFFSDAQSLYKEAVARQESPFALAKWKPDARPKPSHRPKPGVRYVKGEFAPPSPPPPPPKPEPEPESSSQKGGLPPEVLGYFTYHSSRPPYQWLLWTIFTLNSLIYLGWMIGSDLPEFHQFMCNNFLAGTLNLDQGRWWSFLLTSLSQDHIGYLFINMFLFLNIAPITLSIVGPKAFVKLYLGAGAVASLISVGWKRYIAPALHRDDLAQKSDPNQNSFTVHGASGPTYTLLTTYALLSPHTKWNFLLIMPLPAWVHVTGILSYQVIAALANSELSNYHVGHIGSILFGIVFWRVRLRTWKVFFVPDKL